jgi:hypothetical protein
MTKLIIIADRDDASSREVNRSRVQRNDCLSGERPLGSSESQPGSRSSSAAAPPFSGLGTLSCDPRFIAGTERAITAAPEWNRSTQSANARLLAIVILALACLGPASELVQNGSIDLLSTTTLGSAALASLAAMCWRFGKSKSALRSPISSRRQQHSWDQDRPSLKYDF